MELEEREKAEKKKRGPRTSSVRLCQTFITTTAGDIEDELISWRVIFNDLFLFPRRPRNASRTGTLMDVAAGKSSNCERAGVTPHLARTFSTAILAFVVTGPTHVLYGFAALNLASK